MSKKINYEKFEELILLAKSGYNDAVESPHRALFVNNKIMRTEGAFEWVETVL